MEPKIIKVIIEALHSYKMALIMRGVLTTEKNQEIDAAIKAVSEDLGEVKH